MPRRDKDPIFSFLVNGTRKKFTLTTTADFERTEFDLKLVNPDELKVDFIRHLASTDLLELLVEILGAIDNIFRNGEFPSVNDDLDFDVPQDGLDTNPNFNGVTDVVKRIPIPPIKCNEEKWHSYWSSLQAEVLSCLTNIYSGKPIPDPLDRPAEVRDLMTQRALWLWDMELEIADLHQHFQTSYEKDIREAESWYLQHWTGHKGMKNALDLSYQKFYKVPQLESELVETRRKLKIAERRVASMKNQRTKTPKQRSESPKGHRNSCSGHMRDNSSNHESLTQLLLKTLLKEMDHYDKRQ